MNTKMETDEPMEDLGAIQDKLNKEFRQRQYEQLRNNPGATGLIKLKLNLFTKNLMTKPSWQAPFAIVLLYILCTGIYYTLADLFTYKTATIILLCTILAYLDKIREYIRKSKSFINHISFRISSVFIKRK